MILSSGLCNKLQETIRLIVMATGEGVTAMDNSSGIGWNT